jgi:16S rRNA processing protein RimM
LTEGQSGHTDLLEVGRIVKAHGLRGEVLVHLSTDRVERVQPGAELSTDRGTLTVQASRPHQGRWLVLFDGIVGRDAAETWRGVVLRAEPIDDPGALWIHELIGCRVVDAAGLARGIVTAVQDNPASDLLVLDTGALVPLTFVVEGPTDGVVHVEVPDGLFELFEG